MRIRVLNENYENWTRQDFINELMRLGYNYKFEKYTTDQLYHILNKSINRQNNLKNLDAKNYKTNSTAKFNDINNYKEKDGYYKWNGIIFPSYEEMIEYQNEQGK